MFTWGFLRSNLPRAARTVKVRRGVVVEEGVRRRTVVGWRKEEERGVSLWVLVEERKGVEIREEDEAWGNSISLEEA
ncbi:hypothetical protein PUW80_15000, partial [Microbacterium sp. NE1TT3]